MCSLYATAWHDRAGAPVSRSDASGLFRGPQVRLNADRPTPNFFAIAPSRAYWPLCREYVLHHRFGPRARELCIASEIQSLLSSLADFSTNAAARPGLRLAKLTLCLFDEPVPKTERLLLESATLTSRAVDKRSGLIQLGKLLKRYQSVEQSPASDRGLCDLLVLRRTAGAFETHADMCRRLAPLTALPECGLPRDCDAYARFLHVTRILQGV